MKPTTTRPCSPRAVRRVVANGAIDLVEDRAGAIQKCGARVGQFYATRLAAKQLYIEFLFQRADLHAQRRLLNAEPLGGAGHVFFFRDGDEVAQDDAVPSAISIRYRFRTHHIFYPQVTKS